jgi:23S rRNA pseudouridine2604 synthase
MGFRKRIKYFLVHTMNFTNKGADKIIASGTLSINGNIIVQNEIVEDGDELKLDGKIIRSKKEYRYFALNKPVGIECSFNEKIKNNLSTVFPFDNSYFIAGRLDKASKGLLLVSNDGKWVNGIANPLARKEKEYHVEVNKELTPGFIVSMRSGVDIGFCITQSCRVKKLSSTLFSIVLTEGKNQQIRRMCKKFGYSVLSLERIRVDKFYLSDLQSLKYIELKT